MKKSILSVFVLLGFAKSSFAADLDQMSCVVLSGQVFLEAKFGEGPDFIPQKLRAWIRSAGEGDISTTKERCEKLTSARPTFRGESWDNGQCVGTDFVLTKSVEFSLLGANFWFSPVGSPTPAFVKVTRAPGNSTSDLCNPL